MGLFRRKIEKEIKEQKVPEHATIASTQMQNLESIIKTLLSPHVDKENITIKPLEKEKEVQFHINFEIHGQNIEIACDEDKLTLSMGDETHFNFPLKKKAANS